MTLNTNTILITISYLGKEHHVQASKDQYESLMCLISDHIDVSNFGTCYGGGSCGTCGVEIRENSTGQKKFSLSCEIEINAELKNKIIEMID